MNKKIFPLFSWLLMFVLAFMSFTPAYAAGPDPAHDVGGVYPPGYVPEVKLQVFYNVLTNRITLTAAFADNSPIQRGDVILRHMMPNKKAVVVKTAVYRNTKQIKLNYAVPWTGMGTYCATVALGSNTIPGVNPSTTVQRVATKCVAAPVVKIYAQ